jgi:O-antigen ligase
MELSLPRSAAFRAEPRATVRRGSAWWMVAALLFSMIPEGIAVSVFGRTPLISLFDITLIAFGSILFLRSILGTFTFDLTDKPVLFLALAYTFAQMLCFLFNLEDVPRGFLAIKVFVFGFLCYLVCVSVLKNSTDVRLVIESLVHWGGAIGLLLVYHFITDWSSLIGDVARYESKSEIGIAIGRSNYLAALLVPILPIAVAAFLSARGFRRFLLSISTALIFAGLVITMSKGAFLALLAGSLCAFPLLRQAGVKMKHLAIFLGAVTLLLLLFGRELLLFNYEMIVYRVDNPDMGRVDLWKVAWDAFVSHPLLGVGPNAIYIYNRQFAADDLYTHNYVLNTLAELGVVGSIPFFLLIGVLLRRSYCLCVSMITDPKLKYVTLGLFVGILSTLIHGLVEPTFQGQQYAVIFWICMAAVYLYWRLSQGTVLATSALLALSRPIGHKANTENASPA